MYGRLVLLLTSLCEKQDIFKNLESTFAVKNATFTSIPMPHCQYGITFLYSGEKSSFNTRINYHELLGHLIKMFVAQLGVFSLLVQNFFLLLYSSSVLDIFFKYPV